MSDNSLEGVGTDNVFDAVVQGDLSGDNSNPAKELNKEAEESKVSDDAEAEEEKAEKTEKKTEEKKDQTAGEKTLDGLKKRLSRQTAANKQVQEQRAREKVEYERQIQALNDQLGQFKNQKSDEPKLEDYETNEEYVAAQAEHLANKKASEMIEKQRQDEMNRVQEVEQARRRKDFEEKVHNFRIDNPDYPEVEQEFNQLVGTLNHNAMGNPQMTETLGILGEILVGSESTPALIYELGKTPELAEQLSNMSKVDAARELFKLEASIKSKGATKRQTKKAPAPVEPVNSSKGKYTKSLDDMGSEELLNWVQG